MTIEKAEEFAKELKKILENAGCLVIVTPLCQSQNDDKMGPTSLHFIVTWEINGEASDLPILREGKASMVLNEIINFAKLNLLNEIESDEE